MEGVRVKEEPVDDYQDLQPQPQSQPSPQPSTWRSRSSADGQQQRGRKRRREAEEEEEEESGRPRVQIKTEGIFEDEDSNETVLNEATGTEEMEMKDVQDKKGPPLATNFFNFAASGSGLGLEDLGRSNVERQKVLNPPERNIPQAAHYNAHDEQEEIQYVKDREDERRRPLLDHEKLKEDGDSEEESEPEYEDWRNPGIAEIKEKVWTKFDFIFRRFEETKHLAVHKEKEKILKAIDNHRFVIVEGFTGCGKTTQVPQFILDQCYEKKRQCNIFVTQPRKIAAISVARRVCDERNWKLGDVVGYQVGMEACKGEDTLLTYMTTGVLLHRLITTRCFRNITHIIIDEVHERDLESDLLLLVIKKILLDDKDGSEQRVKFILMSATLNAKKFSKYFLTQTSESEVTESPVIKIPHLIGHKVEEIFLDAILVNNSGLLEEISTLQEMEKAVIPEELYTVAVDCIVKLDECEKRASHDPRFSSAKREVKVDKRGSVLVFLPGMEEINRLYRALNLKNRDDVEEASKNDNFKGNDFHKWDIVPLHSTITSEEQQRVFERARPYHRKIILSTNIAESSVTVPDVAYVIDFCLTKSLCVDPYTNFTTLRMVWASVSQCIQRKGRTGRVCSGKVFRLVTKSFFSGLPQHTKPEMLRSSLETVVLQLKKLNLGSPKELLAMAIDPPVVSGIERAVANLKEVGALTIEKMTRQGPVYDTCDGDLTFLGQIMTDLPIPQQCTRLIMLGYCFGVLNDAIIIAASLSVKNPFCTPFKAQLEAYLSRLNWSKKSHSDLFALLYVYKHWIKQFSPDASTDENSGIQQTSRNKSTYIERQWAKGANVQLSVLREIRSTVNLINERLAKYSDRIKANDKVFDGNTPEITPVCSLMLKVAIAGSFYPNYFHPSVKLNEREMSKEICGLDLLNTVFFKGFPVGHDGKVYAKLVADYLSFGLNVPCIRFDGQKVLATFDNRGEKIGPINKGLYRALKRLQIRELLEIPLTSPEHERQILKDWDHRRKSRTFTPCPPQVQLPGVDVQRVYVRVTHVENPGQFWVNYVSRVPDMDLMLERINNELLPMPIHPSKIVPNALCLAAFQGMYYRAKILLSVRPPVDESLVYFVDYGNSCWVRNSTMFDFTPSLVAHGYVQLPCLAVECRLSNIKPASVHGTGWTENARRELGMFAENAPLTCIDIYSVTKSVICGKLIGHEHGEHSIEQNLNDKLIAAGYAEPMDEPTYSELNHRARVRVSLQDSGERMAHNREQIGEQMEFDFVQPSLDYRNCNKVLLKGPWSPLELKFVSLCQSSNTKRVIIDNNSVNSVVLETEPTAPIQRLLVAAHVGINDRSGSVVARGTTIMPAVRGIMGLMSMLFAPKIEMRVDIRQTRYNGVLCGLGIAPNGITMPVYPDHDVEIVFDTIIDDEDIDVINHIRFCMNCILRRYKRGMNITLSGFQHEAVDGILRLLQKQRKPAEENWPTDEYRWNCIDPAFLVPSSDHLSFQPSDIFTLHNKVKLRQEAPPNWTWNFAV